MAAALFAALPVQAQEWKTFTSNMGFSVQYPANWLTRGALPPERLDIYSEPGGMNGAVIKEGQAGIVVMRELLIQTVADEIAQSGHDDPILRRRTITSDIGNCRRVREMVFRIDFVDPKKAPKGYVPQQADNFYCETDDTLVMVNVFYWADDKNQAKWRQIARKMVSTLRVKNCGPRGYCSP